MQIAPLSRDDVAAIPHAASRAGERRRAHQRPVRRVRLGAGALSQQELPAPDAGGLLPRQPHRPRHAVPRRHEPRRQGIRRLAGPGRSGRARALALRRCRAGAQGCPHRQSFRHRPGRGGHAHRAHHASGRTPRALAWDDGSLAGEYHCPLAGKLPRRTAGRRPSARGANETDWGTGWHGGRTTQQRTRRQQHGNPPRTSSRRSAKKVAKPARRSPYDTDLDRNPANYEPLSPLSFLPRAAAIFPKRTAIIHGTIRRNWAETHLRCRAPGLGADAARHPARRHRGADGAEHPRGLRGAFRRADGRRRAQRAQHPARRRGDRLHARPRRGEG